MTPAGRFLCHFNITPVNHYQTKKGVRISSGIKYFVRTISNMATEKLDFIIFGATGFTGKYTVKHAAKICAEKQLTFGVSGRRKEALEAVVKEYATGFENVPIIIADLKEEDTLKKMTEQAKVLVNCCGPYRFYGEPVVKACIATGTHYVDVSGEPQFIETMQLKYNKAAEEAGVYVISACGFDSIPTDLGIIFTQDKFQGEINSIETYLTCSISSPIEGPVIHYGTWESLIYSFKDMKNLRSLRKQVYPEPLPELWPRLKKRGVLHKSPISRGWSVPFPGSDRSVAYRTQRFLYENFKQRPAQVQTYVTFSSLLAVFELAFVSLIIGILCRYEFGRTLLLKYPAFFSAGFVSHEGPKEKTMENTKFSIKFKADGWTEKLAEPTDKHASAPNKEMITKVTGFNPGYGATCVALLLSATTILEESDKMPNNGGVLTPGGAFGKTSIVEGLNKHDLTFEVISSKEN